jgi:hypothetical protein
MLHYQEILLYIGTTEELRILLYNRRIMYTLFYQNNCPRSGVTQKNDVYFGIAEELYVSV